MTKLFFSRNRLVKYKKRDKVCIVGRFSWKKPQWITLQVGNCKVVDSRFGFGTGQCIGVNAMQSLRKMLSANISIMGSTNLPVVVTQSG